jgi:hypothetical protein
VEIEHLSFGDQWDYYDFKASPKDVFLLYLDRLEHKIVGFIIACCSKLRQCGVILRLAVHPDYGARASPRLSSSIPSNGLRIWVCMKWSWT